jgi:hypothetical protein
MCIVWKPAGSFVLNVDVRETIHDAAWRNGKFRGQDTSTCGRWRARNFGEAVLHMFRHHRGSHGGPRELEEALKRVLYLNPEGK